jgi:lantibiotic modifying enzyme
MCEFDPTSGVTRRSFLRLTAAGSLLLWGPERLAALVAGETALTPLDTALAASRWIRGGRIGTPDGVTWPAVPGAEDSVGISLYTHSPGVVLFLSELVHATQDEEALGDAMAGADHLTAAVLRGDVRDPGLYTGMAGIGYALEQVHRVSGEPRFRRGASACIDRLVESARGDRGGLGWSATPDGSLDGASSDIVSGSAGVGLTLLWAHETLDHPLALATAEATGRRLLALAREESEGLRWDLAPGYARNYPNFSHGTGGVAYFLARLGMATANRDFVDAAVAGGRYLQSISLCDDDGCAVYHHEPGGEDLFYLSWCHGPVGTSRLFHQLALATGDDTWRDWVHRGAKAIQSFGVPERRSPGYWNNISQCCGDAGVGTFFLALEELTGDTAHHRFAERVGNWIVGQASGDEVTGQHWVQAENRVSPEAVMAQTGWMQGAAGVGAFFLHLDGRAVGRRALVRLPDSPWG